MIYNTCLQPSSYDNLPEADEVVDFVRRSSNPYAFRYEHVARKWEYGLAYRFIKEFKPKSLLNVGGGNSPLSSLALREVKYVSEIDPVRPGEIFPNITYIVEKFPCKTLPKYDLILCTSVIEHIEDDETFFRELLNHANKYLFLTMDFHPSGKSFSINHLRTYNEISIEKFMDIAMYEYTFSTIGEVNYKYKTPMVYDYTFAAMGLVKIV